MITSSGAICDVCGHHILPLNPDERVHTFSVKQVDRDLHCDNKCKEAVQNCGGNWENLPAGPLRSLFEKAAKELEAA